MEKLALIKEVNRMKQLNGHLETRLEEQERRLSLVTTELGKTWHVVGRLRRHHHQLHTHEKILKYELQQKRKLLNELKDELEYCREKWEQAREKNSQTEHDWRKLRAEFSNRKIKSTSPSFNNSGESGYSDERPSDDSSESNDESEYVTEPKARFKKKSKKSVEAILDSSADFNLVAEREDPASDMIDVAELPLDTQDDTSGLEASVSISYYSDNVHKSNKASDGSEDEVCEITNDSCNDDSSGVEHYCNNDYCCVGKSAEQEDNRDDNQNSHCNDNVNQSTSEIPLIDPASILKSIKEQTERLAKKDEKLSNLEKNSLMVLKKAQSTDMMASQINSTLDHIINRPTTSQNRDSAVPNTDDAIVQSIAVPVFTSTSLETDQEIPTTKVNDDVVTIGNAQNCDSFENNENTSASNPASTNVPQVAAKVPEINPSSILESIRKQNERLAKRDERLQKLEQDCTNIVKIVTNTIKASDDISNKLDNLHDKHNNSSSQDNVTEDNRETPEPSTSTESDHEARFAARDLRLKRLEEQTKSLVNRVNKTTSKGVKIHYKLEELHNIYGSEGSRAGTPSDESEDKPQNSEEQENDDKE